MKMKASLALCLLVVCSIPMIAAEPAKATHPPMSAQEKAAMDAAMKAATPGPEHQKLAEMVGTWDATVKMWNAPGTEPAVSTGVSKNSSVLGGRFLHQEFTGSFMGMPFTGLGYSGYDNVTKQYIGTWMDSFSTGIMNSIGTCKDGNCTYTSTMSDALSGKVMQSTMKLNVVNADKHVMEMWAPGPGGKDFKMMEITYTRKKS